MAEALDAHWQPETPPEVVLADGDVDTGCGGAQAEEGSFFCGEDRTVYLQQDDLTALAGLPDADRAAAETYLLAHEYAHAVQDGLGLDEGADDRGPGSRSVAYELQADCLAGVFVAAQRLGPVASYRRAVRDGGDDVGEDPLPPEESQHGTGAQRVEAFDRGRSGGATACGVAAR